MRKRERESERKREREKERKESRDRPKPSSPRLSKASISEIVEIVRWNRPLKSSAEITGTKPIARSADRDHVKLRSRSQSREVSGLDDFFLGFVCVLRNEWYYIFVWQPRKCEKMWTTSRKCVFYGILKNTTKHQKIFFETLFEMQPNTWKLFPFRKIEYFPEMLLHEPNAA